MKAILATDAKWQIGKNNDLLYNLPEDKKFFRKMTKGKVVIMGRKTLESLPGGKPLPDRTNFILSNSIDLKALNTTDYIGRMLYFTNIINKNYDDDDVFIIGGGSVYNQYIPYCDTVYRTRITKSIEGDTYIKPLPIYGFELSGIIEEATSVTGDRYIIEEWVRVKDEDLYKRCVITMRYKNVIDTMIMKDGLYVDEYDNEYSTEEVDAFLKWRMSDYIHSEPTTCILRDYDVTYYDIKINMKDSDYVAHIRSYGPSISDAIDNYNINHTSMSFHKTMDVIKYIMKHS